MTDAPAPLSPDELAGLQTNLLRAYANLYRLREKALPDSTPTPGFNVCGSLPMGHDYSTELVYAKLLTEIMGSSGDPFTRVATIMAGEQYLLLLHNDYHKVTLPTPETFQTMMEQFDLSRIADPSRYGSPMVREALSDPVKRAALQEPFAPKQYRREVRPAADRAEQAWGVRPRFA